MINAKMTMDGASIDRVATPRIVSTAESLTRAELFTADPSLGGISAYNYAGALPTDVVYPLFFSDLPTAVISVRANWIDNVGDPGSYSFNFLISDPRVQSVVDAINSTWPGAVDVSVTARADGSRLVLSMAAREPLVEVVSLEILNAVAVPNACAATEVWPFAMFRYFEPDRRAISRVGDVVPPPPRPGTFTTPLSRGVAHGEDRTSASLNRGIDEITRDLLRRDHTADLLTAPVALRGVTNYTASVTEVSLDPLATGDSFGAPVRVLSHPSSAGTFIAVRGARWRAQRDMVRLVDASLHADLTLSSTPHTLDRGGDHRFIDATTEGEWVVVTGPESTMITAAPGHYRSPTSDRPLVTTGYRMVDEVTIEFLEELDPTLRLTEMVIKDSATQAGMYVTSWLGGWRATVRPFNGASDLRVSAGNRAGVQEGLSMPAHGTALLHRGPYVEPHEWLVKHIGGAYVLDHLNTVYAVGDAAGYGADVDTYSAPGGVQPYVAFVSDVTRADPTQSDRAPRAVDSALLQTGRGGLNAQQRVPLPVGPLHLPTTMSGAADEEGRASIAPIASASRATDVYLPPPAGMLSPYSGISDVDSIAYLLVSGDDPAILSAEELAMRTSAHISATEPAELERQRVVARGYVTISFDGVDVYGGPGRVVRDQGGFTQDLTGRAGFIPEIGLVAITAVFSGRHAQFTVLDAITKDPITSTTAIDTTMTVVPNTAASQRDPEGVRRPTTSRFWANDEESDYLIDITGSRQIIAGERYVGSSSAYIRVDQSGVPYAVFTLGPGISDEQVAGVTGSSVAHTAYLYGDYYPGNQLEDLFNGTPGTSDVSYRSPVSYEFFAMRGNHFYRGRVAAPDAVALVESDRVYALACRLPDVFSEQGDGPLSAGNAVLYMRANNLQLTAERAVHGSITARELLVHGDTRVVGHDGGSETADVLTRVNESQHLASTAARSVYDGNYVFSGITASPDSARVSSYYVHSESAVLHGHVSYCDAEEAAHHVYDQAERCITDTRGLWVVPGGLVTEGASSDGLLSRGRFGVTHRTLVETESHSVDVLERIRDLEHQVARLTTVASLSASAVRDLNARWHSLYYQETERFQGPCYKLVAALEDLHDRLNNLVTDRTPAQVIADDAGDVMYDLFPLLYQYGKYGQIAGYATPLTAEDVDLIMSLPITLSPPVLPNSTARSAVSLYIGTFDANRRDFTGALSAIPGAYSYVTSGGKFDVTVPLDAVSAEVSFTYGDIAAAASGLGQSRADHSVPHAVRPIDTLSGHRHFEEVSGPRVTWPAQGGYTPSVERPSYTINQGCYIAPRTEVPTSIPLLNGGIASSADITQRIEQRVLPLLGFAYSTKIAVGSAVEVRRSYWLPVHYSGGPSGRSVPLSAQPSRDAALPAAPAPTYYALNAQSPYPFTAPDDFMSYSPGGTGNSEYDIAVDRPDYLTPIYVGGIIFAFTTAELANEAMLSLDSQLYARYTSLAGEEYVVLTDIGITEFARAAKEIYRGGERALSARQYSKTAVYRS